KDWNSINVADGKVLNLTKGLPGDIKFHSEDHDTPSAPQPYGIAGWTPDEYFVLVHDKYDIWKVAAKGGGYENLTAGLGRKEKTQFRNVKLDPKDKSVDLSKPLLLRAEHLRPGDSGCSRLDAGGGQPQPLIMQPRNFGTPTRAKFADVFLLTVSNFYDFPNLYVTRSSFQILARISDANPQQKQ